jgi:hypothetical protein
VALHLGLQPNQRMQPTTLSRFFCEVFFAIAAFRLTIRFTASGPLAAYPPLRWAAYRWTA